MKRTFLSFIHFYQVVISPLLHQTLGVPPGGGCRYTPTCSEYASQVIKEYGILRGSIKSLKRVLSCQPFFHGKHI